MVNNAGVGGGRAAAKSSDGAEVYGKAMFEEDMEDWQTGIALSCHCLCLAMANNTVVQSTCPTTRPFTSSRQPSSHYCPRPPKASLVLPATSLTSRPRVQLQSGKLSDAVAGLHHSHAIGTFLTSMTGPKIASMRTMYFPPDRRRPSTSLSDRGKQCSKAATNHLTRLLAYELSNEAIGIRVNAICPGAYSMVYHRQMFCVI